MALAGGLLCLSLVVVAFGVLAHANHVFRCALVINNDTRALFQRMTELGALGPRTSHHEIPPPPPSPDVAEPMTMTVDAPPGHNPHGPCTPCGSQHCREAGTKPAPISTRGLPKVPGTDEGPPSHPSRTLVGLSPIPFITRKGTLERGG